MRPQRGRGSPTRPPTPLDAHLFRKHGRPFLFDPCTRTSFVLDAVGEVAAREMLGGKSVPLGVSRNETAGARTELAALRRSGHFRFAQPPLTPLDPNRWWIPYPIISKACNLRCRYCFVNPSGPTHMSREAMEATAALIAERAKPYDPSYTVWIGFAGESTTYFAQFDEFRSLLAEAGRRVGVDLTARVTSTNATLFCDPAVGARVDEFLTPGQTTVVSLDGPPEAHDALRVHPDRRGTYDEVIRGVQRMREAGIEPKASAAVTALFPDVSEVYLHLLGLGFLDIQVKPVRARPDESYYIGRNLGAICAGYDRLAGRLPDLPDMSLRGALKAMVGTARDDYFARFLIRVIGRHLLQWRCNTWVHSVWVDTDGRLYGCQPMLGVPEACIGSVWDGIDEARVRELHDMLHISRREPCNRCWARFVCGGGCMHQSYLTFGRFEPPDPAECALNRHLIELAIWFWAELKEKRPAVAAELQGTASRLRTELDGPLAIAPPQP